MFARLLVCLLVFSGFSLAEGKGDGWIDFDEAALRAQTPRSREARAFWEHAGTGAYPGDWPRTARELRLAGFNMILPNMLWGGAAHFPAPPSALHRGARY